MANSLQAQQIVLPDVKASEASLVALTQSVGVPRDVLATEKQIAQVWQQLPDLLLQVAPDKRDAQLAKMCVAVSVGLFDGAINYIWNAAVSALRAKIINFGLDVVSEIKGSQIDEAKLDDYKDAELLKLCLEANLLSEEGYFLLDQSRATRNTLSAAHPPIGALDAFEFLAFLNRCSKYALGQEVNPQGVNVQKFLNALKAGKFSADNMVGWQAAIQQTHNAQRGSVYTMLHGIYCDPNSNEDTRNNALGLCLAVQSTVSAEAIGRILKRHAEYIGGGDIARSTASKNFFEKTGRMALLPEMERHAILSSACDKLMGVHQAMNNFYNEPPFAERLYELSKQAGIPSPTKTQYVDTVISCAIGNGYGVSNAAYVYYRKMVEGFSPDEIHVMFWLPHQNDGTAAWRIKNDVGCRANYKKLAGLLNAASIPSVVAAEYEKWMKS